MDSLIVGALVLNRLIAQGVASVFTKDLTELESSSLQGGAYSTKGLNIFISYAAASGKVAVSSGLKQLFEIPVTVVLPVILITRGDQGKRCRLLTVRVAGIEVGIEHIRITLHLGGVL